MSRCLPFSPEAYSKRRSSHDALFKKVKIKSLRRIEKDLKKKEEERKSLRRREKELKKKLREHADEAEKRHRHVTDHKVTKLGDDKYYRQTRIKADSKDQYPSKGIVYESESSEKSGVTEEFEPPTYYGSICDVPHRTETTNKRKRRDDPVDEFKSERISFHVRLPLKKHDNNLTEPGKNCFSKRSDACPNRPTNVGIEQPSPRPCLNLPSSAPERTQTSDAKKASSGSICDVPHRTETTNKRKRQDDPVDEFKSERISFHVRLPLKKHNNNLTEPGKNCFSKRSDACPDRPTNVGIEQPSPRPCLNLPSSAPERTQTSDAKKASSGSICDVPHRTETTNKRKRRDDPVDEFKSERISFHVRLPLKKHDNNLTEPGKNCFSKRSDACPNRPTNVGIEQPSPRPCLNLPSSAPERTQTSDAKKASSGSICDVPHRTETTNKRKRQDDPVDEFKSERISFHVRLPLKKHNNNLTEPGKNRFSKRSDACPDRPTNVGIEQPSPRPCLNLPSSAPESTQTSDAKKASSSVNDLRLKRSIYEMLVEDWVPPTFQQLNQLDDDDEDWLFGSRKQHKQASKRHDVVSCSSSTTLWPQAKLLPDVNIYALPYTVPF